MHRRIKVWQRQIAISMKSISKSVIEMVDLRKSYPEEIRADSAVRQFTVNPE